METSETDESVLANFLSPGKENEELELKPEEAIEIGAQAVWSVSSCKPGYGVGNLRDNSTDTYWQSDGTQPHLINIEFTRKTAVQKIQIYVDYKQDESYTPSKISVRCGTNFHDLQKVRTVELDEPDGWMDVPTVNENEQPVKAFLFQVAILSNHQNGRDTHIRQVRVFEPKWTAKHSTHIHSDINLADLADFQSIEFTSMLTLR